MKVLITICSLFGLLLIPLISISGPPGHAKGQMQKSSHAVVTQGGGHHQGVVNVQNFSNPTSGTTSFVAPTVQYNVNATTTTAIVAPQHNIPQGNVQNLLTNSNNGIHVRPLNYYLHTS